MTLLEALKILKKFNESDLINYSYSLNYKGEETNCNIPDDIIQILWFHWCKDDDCSCDTHYSKNIYIIARTDDDMICFITMMGSYNEDDELIFKKINSEFTDTFRDLYNMCMSNTERELHDKSSDEK